MEESPFADSFLFLVGRIYYFVVNVIFVIYNSFKPRVVVPAPTNKLLFLSAKNATEAIRAKKIKCSDLIEAYITRCEEVNPIINAIVSDNFAAARQKAAEVDALISAADDIQLDELSEKKPLLGIPFTAKDLVPVKGHPETIGQWRKKDDISMKNAEIVDRLEEAGAIFLALTNVPDSGLAGETVNSLFGRTHNPYDSRRTAGGSSGGEGALIGAGASLIGIGTDLGGSIRFPSYCGGIFGLAPSPCTISEEGLILKSINYIKQMRRTGPMCRYAEDLAIMYSVLSGLKDDDEIKTGPGKVRVFYLEEFDSPGEKPCKEVKEAIHKAVAFLEKKYETTAVQIRLPQTRHALDIYRVSILAKGQPTMWERLATKEEYENSSLLREWFRAVLSGGVSKTHAACALTFGLHIDQLPLANPDKMITLREHLKGQLASLLGNNGILLCPTMPTLPDFHHYFVWKMMSNVPGLGIFNALGLPGMQCPLGLSSNGLPTGVQIIGHPGTDFLLMKVAQDIEEAFGGWTPPAAS